MSLGLLMKNALLELEWAENAPAFWFLTPYFSSVPPLN
jgi:hypothetical protein